MNRSLATLAAVTLCLAACKRGGDEGATGPLRLAYFPNVTHAHALVGTAQGKLAEALGGPQRLAVRQFNAGPAAMEALLAGDVDLSYVGPGPATIAFLRSQGALRVIAGGVSGGAVVVARDASGPKDLVGKRVSSPQLGNTQDIALRRWVKQAGLEIGEGPGKVNVTPLPNADILQLFQRGDVAAAWVPEPWGARLVQEGKGKILLDERTLWKNGVFPTTILVASTKALERRRADVIAVLKAHVALTAQWKADPPAFARAANAEYGRLTGHPLPEAVLQQAFGRLDPTNDPMKEQLLEGARHARELSFAPDGDLSQLVDDSLLREANASASR
jgi:NitT/TauT family transport system substrate-binding protein